MQVTDGASLTIGFTTEGDALQFKVDGRASAASSSTQGEAEGNLEQEQSGNSMTITEVEEAKIDKRREIVPLCNIANYFKPIAVGEFLQTRPTRNSYNQLAQLCAHYSSPTVTSYCRRPGRVGPGIEVGPVQDIHKRDKWCRRPVANQGGSYDICVDGSLHKRTSKFEACRGNKYRDGERFV